MNIALLGYGVMNRAVEAQAAPRGHRVALALDADDAPADADELMSRLSAAGVDVAIDFSVAEAVPRHVEACARLGLPLVEGTTGWQSRLAEMRDFVAAHERAAVVYGANFSIGVNLFYLVAAHAAQLFARFDEYDVFLEEAHHARKRDAPSGTALRLRDILTSAAGGAREISVASTRAGHIPGTHRVGFDAAADTVTLEHAARSRAGFAAGALFAAEWIAAGGRRGFYEFGEAIDEVLK